MVLNDHHVTYVELSVQATSRVGDDEQLDAQQPHGAHWQHDRTHFVALVIVEASAHTYALNLAFQYCIVTS